MEIKVTQTGNTGLLTLIGRLDAISAPELQKAVAELMPEVTQVEFDFAEVEYMSSAGIRVLLGAQKNADKAGKSVVLKNVVPEVKSVFEITGLLDVLRFE
ncbi:MAG: STAS domain-containing protein [Oscillospiraceae bacterium]|nr:STAS domain-containing protein [Oscillospiraceae bacterium]